MKNLLVKLATLSAMVHMSLGCAWHHGLGHPHACAVDTCCHSALSHDRKAPSHDHDDNCPNHPHAHAALAEHHCDSTRHNCDSIRHTRGDNNSDCPACINACENQHCHTGCQDDGCNYIESVPYENGTHFRPQPCFGATVVALSSAMLNFPADCSELHPVSAVRAPSVRAHLLLNVQLI